MFDGFTAQRVAAIILEKKLEREFDGSTGWRWSWSKRWCLTAVPHGVIPRLESDGTM